MKTTENIYIGLSDNTSISGYSAIRPTNEHIRLTPGCNDDDVITSVVRMLFSKDRIKDALCSFEISRYSYDSSQANDKDNEDFVKLHLEAEINSKNRFHIRLIKRVSKEVMSKSALINEQCSGFVLNKVLSKYCNKNGGVYVYMNKENNSACIFFSRGQAKPEVMHRLASIIPIIMPKMFDEIPVNDIEKSILRELAQEEINNIHELFKQWVNSLDLRKSYINEKLKGFTLNSVNRRITTMQRDIRNLEEQLDGYLRNARITNDGINDKKLALSSLLISNNDDKTDNELIDFILRNKSIHIASGGSKSTIYFVVTVPLDSFDEDVYKTYVTKNNKANSYVFDSSCWSIEDTKKVYDAIWLSSDYQMMCYAGYTIDDNAFVQAYNGINTNNIECEYINPINFIANPHIKYYNCLGQYRQMFDDCRNRCDWIGALATAIQSARSIDFAESTSCGHLIMDMFNNLDKPIIHVMATDEYISIREVYHRVCGSTAQAAAPATQEAPAAQETNNEQVDADLLAF